MRRRAHHPPVPLCGAEATEFAARPRLHPDGFVGSPRHDVRTSRWRASPTTFGPIGRLLVTTLMIGMLVGALAMLGWFTPFALWYVLGWSIMAGHVLRQVWAPVPIGGRPSGPRAALARRFPRAGRALDPGALLACVVALLVMVGIYAWIEGDTVLRFLIVLASGTVLMVATLLRLTSGS